MERVDVGGRLGGEGRKAVRSNTLGLVEDGEEAATPEELLSGEDVDSIDVVLG